MTTVQDSLNPSYLARLVADALPRLARELRPDVLAALRRALAEETSERGRLVLEQLITNAHIAVTQQVPLCQDTGSVWVLLEVGPRDVAGSAADTAVGSAADATSGSATGATVDSATGTAVGSAMDAAGGSAAGATSGATDDTAGDMLSLPADLFSLMDEAVAGAYTSALLRKSLVRDALCDRSNTGDNSPAFCELYLNPYKRGATLHIMLKGGGSDNASKLVMLAPGAGVEGVRRVVLDAVREKGESACPPLIIGVGVGSTFDKVGGLAKRALLRRLDEVNLKPELAALERGLLADINALGIGPGGFGGSTTALAVSVLTAPCHIATLPVAVNIGCNSLRSVSIELGRSGSGSDAQAFIGASLGDE